MWTTIQIVLGLLGLLLALGGNWLSMPMVMYAGIVCFAFAAIAIGWEAIIKRHIVIGSRYRGTSQTYTGLAAIMQGIQFNLIGFFLLGVTAAMYMNNGGEIVLYFVRRPGLALILFGALCLMQAVISISGSREYRQGPRWMVILNLLFSRLLPGLILTLIGLGAVGLGVFEFLAPAAFDKMGGEFLEMLYSIR